METIENNSTLFLRSSPNIEKWYRYPKNTTRHRNIREFSKNTFWIMYIFFGLKNVYFLNNVNIKTNKAIFNL